MKKILLRAPVLSQSGYGVHSRQVARWLLSYKDVDLTILPVQWGGTPWYINADYKGGFIGELMKRARNDKGPFDVSFQLQLPNEWDPKLASKNIGITAGVETDVCNPNWVQCVNTMDHVIVPSEHTKSVFTRTASRIEGAPDVTNKISVIPESFVDEILDESIQPLDLDIDTSFNFMLVGQLTGRSSQTDRKNTFNAIKWFCETFKDDNDVGLVIKTNNGRETRIDRKVTYEMLNQVIKMVRKGPYPKIHFIHGTLEDSEMAALYRHPKIKAYLTLTRGEGFGLPILEAAASGLPIIATNWSSYLDFLKLGRFVKLDYQLTDIHKTRVDNNIFIQGSKWAEVAEHDVKKKLTKFRNSSDMPKAWAAELKGKLQEAYSFNAVKLQYEKLFEELKL